MKVAELKKGMLIRPKGNNNFVIGFAGLVMGVADDRRRKGELEKIAVYVGNRKDVGGAKNVRNIEWSNRYMLFQGKIFAIDPSDWHRLEPAT